MTTVISGDTGISPVTATGTSALVDGMTVGRGAGEVSTNTAVGASALAANTIGDASTAIGLSCLAANTTGDTNTATGYQALTSNQTGSSNSAYGVQAMRYNTTGGANVAVGRGALYENTSGSYNTAMGQLALSSNTTASYNTAVGYQAGYSNTTSAYGTFVGRGAGYSSNAIGNTFVGTTAGYNTTTGTYNTFIGFGATSGDGAGASVTTGSKNTIIGGYSGNQGGLDIRTASNYIVLSDGDGTPRLWCAGAADWRSAGTWITSNATPVTASAVGSTSGTAAIWDGSGNLYKQSSSMRYKENIAEWSVTDAQLDAFVNLNPKLWDYTGKQNGCAGFIAEDIEALGLKNAYDTSPLINYSNEGEPDSNRDFALIALQHKVIQRLDAAVRELKAEFDTYKVTHP